MKISRDYANLSLRGKDDLLKKYEKLIEEEHIMDSILKEIKNLKRGEVKPKETKRRSKIGSYFSSEAQQIRYYIYQHNINVDDEVIEKLTEMIGKGEAILRENIVLQTKPPLDVIKFENVPIRYAHNIFGKKEQRCGYGLHKFPFTDQGYSISLAFMPPHYTQMFHNHQVSEYTLVMDKKTVLIVALKKKKKKLNANKNEVIYLSPATVHTLHNPNNTITRNITFKSPRGILDWKPFFDSYKTRANRSGIMKGKLQVLENGKRKEIKFPIKDNFYHYDIKVIELKKNYTMEEIFYEDKYFFVINGDFWIYGKEDIKKKCKKNDYIVIDKNTNFKIKTNKKSEIYTVDIKSKNIEEEGAKYKFT